MVDFARGGTMSESNELTARVETVETKIDRLAQSVDERFNQVDEAIAEQRAHTEFVHERLDGRINALDGKVTALDGKLSALDGKVSTLDGRVSTLQGGFGRLERKLDQFMDRFDGR
jgi:phage shock protein A